MARPADSSENTENDKESSTSASENDAPVKDESSSGSPEVIDAEAIEIVDEDENEEAETNNAFDEHDEPGATSTDRKDVFAPAPPPERRSSVPLILGGVIAGAIGFAVAYSLPYLMDGGQTGFDAETAIADQENRIEALSAELADVRDAQVPPTDLSGLEQSLAEARAATDALAERFDVARDELSTRIDGIETELATLTDRVTTIEVEGGDSSSAQAAEAEEQLARFGAELDRLIAEAEAQISAAEAEAAEIEQAAAAAAEEARQDAAFAELRAAVDAGASYEDLLGDIENVPPVLSSNAKSGVPTLVVLQQDFPAAARAALATERTIPQDATTGERLAAFLKRQTNARSLTPQDGNNADAVLSRADDKLARGDLAAALSELDALSDEARDAMSTWLSRARTRQEAVNAVDALAANMN